MEPYKEKKRERRIRDRERMIQHGKQVFYCVWFNSYHTPEDLKHFHHKAEMHGRIYYNNLKMCSCELCCNPRRSPLHKSKERLTIQERRALDAEKDYEKN